jgi:hypothetical protein
MGGCCSTLGKIIYSALKNVNINELERIVTSVIRVSGRVGRTWLLMAWIWEVKEGRK